MIGYIKGTLEYVGVGYIVVEANGIGYNIFVSSNTVSKLNKSGKNVKVYTVMNVKEDGISLYGFAEKDELEMYKKLVCVSGIGPKSAVSLLASLPPEKISLAIVTGDVKTLAKGQGIGKKTAERLILELKDKITETAVSSDILEDIGYSDGEKQEAAEALAALGFTRSEAYGAVMKVYEKDMSSAQIIKLALKTLSEK